MRRLTMLSAAAMMATTAPVHAQTPQQPSQDQGRNAELIAFCQYQMALDPSLTLGTCMSYFVSGDEGYLTQFCHYLQDHNLLGDATFAQCVSQFHQGQ